MPSVHRGLPLSLVLLTSLAAPAAAQAPLTLARATAQALDRSPAIRQARARTDRADAEVTAARAGWFPRVSFTEAAHRSDQPVFVFSSLLSARQFGAANFDIDVLNHPGALTFYQRTLGVEQVLFDGGHTQAASRTASLRREAADLSLRQVSADLVVSVTEQYGGILTAEAGQRAAEAASAAATEDLARAERQRDAGRATEADVLTLSAHLADVRQRAIQARGDAAAARAQLNRLTGAPVTTGFTVVEPVPPPLDTTDPAALFGAAEAARPEVAEAVKAEQVARQAGAMARAAWLPRATAQAVWEFDGLTVGHRASGWAAGVDLQWSLSLGGSELAGTRAAAAGLAEARAAADDARAAADADVVAAYERQRAARARLDVGRAAVAQAHESQRIVRDRYDAGLASVADVLRASSLVLDAETSRINALVDALMADARFARAIGRDPFNHP